MLWFVSKFSDKSISFKRPADEAFPVNQVDNIMTRSTLFQEWLRKDFREIHEIHGTGTEMDCLCIAQNWLDNNNNESTTMWNVPFLNKYTNS